jgi:hypothetical protein
MEPVKPGRGLSTRNREHVPSFTAGVRYERDRIPAMLGKRGAGCNTLLVPWMFARKTGGAALNRLSGNCILSWLALRSAKPSIRRNGACSNPTGPSCFRRMLAPGTGIRYGRSIVAGLTSAARSMNESSRSYPQCSNSYLAGWYPGAILSARRNCSLASAERPLVRRAIPRLT